MCVCVYLCVYASKIYIIADNVTYFINIVIIDTFFEIIYTYNIKQQIWIYMCVCVYLCVYASKIYIIADNVTYFINIVIIDTFFEIIYTYNINCTFLQFIIFVNFK